MRTFDDTATTILKRTAPAWYWARKNFSLASVLTIAGIIAAAGGYIISLNTRVVVIQHEVHDLKEVVPNATAVATLTSRLESVSARVSRLETNWDDAARTAGEAPNSARPRARAPRP